MAFILGVGGSPRKNGNSQSILERILEGAAQAGAETRMVLLAEMDIRPCQGCEKCRRDKKCTRLLDGMQQLYPLVEKAQGLVLSSPVHNYNITAWMKAFIDRLYCYYDFEEPRPGGYSSRLAGQGRKALVTAVCEQKDIKEMGVTMEALSMPLVPLGYEIADRLPVTGFFGRGLVKQDEALMQKAFDMGMEFAKGL